MPPVTAKSGFAAKVGAKVNAAVKAHAKDETNYGLIRLPGGINNGVAQLRECGFFPYKPESNMKKLDGTSAVGEYYFRAMGVVVQPLSVATPDGIVPVVNLQTSVMVTCIDTKNNKGEVTTAIEHITGYDGAGNLTCPTNVMNELRKLGAEFSETPDASELEQVALALKEAKPYFRFSTSTSQGGVNPANGKKYEPRVWESWHGTKGLENYTPPATGMEMHDNAISVSNPAPSTNGTSHATAADLAPAPAVEYSDQEDLASLGARADGGDEAAGVKLQEMAEKAGISEEDITAAANWTAIAELLAGGGEGGEEGEEIPPPPKVDEVYNYTPKGAKKAVKCLVKAVDEKAQTVNLQNTENKRVNYKAISWNDLESVE